ncbi:energy transducer TonB [Granulicella sibirica]|uniref:Ferric siderophore transport system, periplasmic binding protein TonB n=1 Tax=Granulicella sibirica TaxID=2479048 RepID=A0A4Q0T4X3_9BACT|nr:energy transducer TonB [Granulicella sibirica]RXH57059.1 Ferric siderophore transport system, periplasmic binding protein TonB [Granulicella sibirica]
MTETSAPIYPPIAKAAHVEGNVILMASFAKDGSVADLQVLSGHAMLKGGTIDFVKGWKANAYPGPRTCPVVVSYVLKTDHTTQVEGRTDVQHYTVLQKPAAIFMDEPGVIGRKHKRFGIF